VLLVGGGLLGTEARKAVARGHKQQRSVVVTAQENVCCHSRRLSFFSLSFLQQTPPESDLVSHISPEYSQPPSPTLPHHQKPAVPPPPQANDRRSAVSNNPGSGRSGELGTLKAAWIIEAPNPTRMPMAPSAGTGGGLAPNKPSVTPAWLELDVAPAGG
jgi:hypothetical protein